MFLGAPKFFHTGIVRLLSTFLFNVSNDSYEWNNAVLDDEFMTFSCEH